MELMKIHELDNVLVVKNRLLAGESIEIQGVSVLVEKELGFGHKIAGRHILKGEAVIKYGVSIGSATADIPVGSHVHLHNLKSNYISTYTLEHEFIKS